MEGFWFIWLAAGVLSSALGAALGALEAVLWHTPRERMDQWPRSPRLARQAGDLAHPRDCLFTFLALGSALARATGWCALWLAAAGAAGSFGTPMWPWVLGFLAPAVLCEVFPAIIAGRRPRAWERPLLRAGAVVWRFFGPFFDRIQPLVATVAGKLFPWSLEARAQLGPEEVETLVCVREEGGEFALPEAEVLTEVLRLSRVAVRHYMTPRVDVVFV